MNEFGQELDGLDHRDLLVQAFRYGARERRAFEAPVLQRLAHLHGYRLKELSFLEEPRWLRNSDYGPGTLQHPNLTDHEAAADNRWAVGWNLMNGIVHRQRSWHLADFDHFLGAAANLGFLADRELVSDHTIDGDTLADCLGLSQDLHRFAVRSIWDWIRDRAASIYHSIDEEERRHRESLDLQLSVLSETGRAGTLSNERGIIPKDVLVALLLHNIVQIDPNPILHHQSPDPNVDLRLGYYAEIWDDEAGDDKVTRIDRGPRGPIVPRGMLPVELSEDQPFILQPNQAMNARLLHKIRLPTNIIGDLDGRSCYAQRGLRVENARQFKPLWEGFGVLELKNESPTPIALRAGDPIAQMRFEWVN